MAPGCRAASTFVLCLCTWASEVQDGMPPTTRAGMAPWDPLQVAVVRQYMADRSSDIEAQLLGCKALWWVASHNRQGEGPFPGMIRRADPRYIEAGIGEAFAQGTLNSAANTTGPESLKNTAIQTCSGGIESLDVQYDYPRELLLLATTPHLWDAIMEAVRRRLTDPVVLAALVGGIPESVDSIAQAGGFDFLFSFMLNSTDNDALFQTALAGLSDNVQNSRKAAEYIANHGGPMRGIETLVKMMPLTIGRHFQQGLGFGLQYEMVHDTVGVLRYDDEDHTWRKEFYRLGYLEWLVSIMLDNPADGNLQDNCCQAIYFMTEGNATVQRELAEVGAIELMAVAIKRFAPLKRTGYCTVMHSCAGAILTFARADQSWLQDIKHQMLEEALTDDVLQFNMMMGSGTPTWEYFPSWHLIELRMLLAAA